MKVTLAVTVVLFGAVSAGRAEPFDPRQVSASAKWLAHIDFDALQSAGLAQKAYDVWLSQDPLKHQLQLRQFRITFGMDPIEDFRSITVFGDRFAPAAGVAVVRAKMDRQRLLQLLARAPGYRTTAYGGHVLHSWTQDQGKPSEHTVTGCFHGPMAAVVGQDAQRVKAVLDLLDGKSESLAEGQSVLSGEVPAGTVFLARAVDLASADLPFKSPIVRKTQLLALAVGEHEGEVFLQVQLMADEPEIAAQVQAAVEGLRALALLQNSDDPDLQKALQAVRVTTEKSTVTVAWKMPVDELVQLAKQQAAKRRKAEKAD